ncbi:solute carrier family 22 member 21-like [Apostichopus japonicus]|uniref:solute carrier family 22 member 21-like n=1 Tax=Stichopus japonicus TaxID=307972 RepID=UPI003AB51E4F
MTFVSTDNILNKLKPFGRLQIILLITSAYIQCFTPLMEQCIVFLAATPEHHCILQEGYYKNQSIPLEGDIDVSQVYSSCREYVQPGIYNDTQDCQNGWEFSTDVYGETIISEWDLVCTNNPAAELGQSILHVGGMVGAFAFGMLADRFGRRPSILLAFLLYDIFCLVICLSPNFASFLVFRFFGGVAHMGIWICINSIVSEYMIPKYRSIAMTVPSVLFSVGLMFMSLLAFLIRDWRYLQLAITAPVVLATFGIWFLPESLRWLMNDAKKEEAVNQLIEKLAKINGTEVPKDIYYQTEPIPAKDIFTIYAGDLSLNCDERLNNSTVQHSSDGEQNNLEKTVKDIESNNIDETKERLEGDVQSKSEEKKTYLDLFKPPVLHVTIVLSVLRFTLTVVYFGFALSTGRLSGDPYLNFFYSALVEVPARILSPFIYGWFRRTYVLSFCHFMCFAALTVILLIPDQTKNGTDLGTLKVWLSLLGKFFITMTLGGLLLLIMELNPTPLRNMGNGWTLCVGRIGAILAPFMLYVDKYLQNFSTILMAALSLVTAFSILTLPDTRKTTQPQTIEDLRQIMKPRNKKKKPEMTEQRNEAFQPDSRVENDKEDEE